MGRVVAATLNYLAISADSPGSGSHVINTTDLLKIPAFPPVASKLLRAAGDKDTNAADLVRLLRSDPALSAAIIRHANSPIYTFTAEVKALDHAVTLLGIRKIRLLALSAISRTYVRATAMVETLRGYWRYSLACALLAEKLARAAHVAEDTAYAAALLHDIGRLGLMVAHPEEYAKLVRYAAADLAAGTGFNLLERERALFGIDRYEAGEWLARTWNLPQEFREAAGKYDAEAREGTVNLTGVVFLACRLANSLGFGILNDPHRTSYEEVLRGLPPAFAACLPVCAEDAIEHIEEEIVLLDSGGDAADEESAERAVGAIRAECSEDEETEECEACVEMAEGEPARRNLWPLFVVAAVGVVLGVVVFLRFTTAG